MSVRKEVIGLATLYCGDCREIIPTIEKPNTIISDPPFNAGKAFANDSMTTEEWSQFCNYFADLLVPLEAENILIEVGKNDTAMRAALDARFRFRWTLCLNYTNAMRQGAVGFSNFGLVLWYGDKCHKRYMDRIDSSLNSTIREFSHPSPKEVTHYHRLVDMFTVDNGIVLDPFLGSGTTGIAAVQQRHPFIGIEIDQGYFEIACRRIEQAQRQYDMFRDANETERTKLGHTL